MYILVNKSFDDKRADKVIASVLSTMHFPTPMYEWTGRFAMFTLLLLIPAALFIVNAIYYAGGICATIILVSWIGMGVLMVEELVKKRDW